MPYVNIPESNLAGGVANIVGKMTGNLSEKIATELNLGIPGLL